MDIANQIREQRQGLGWSQDELVQKLYVSRVTVSHWETGKTLPDVQSMLLLANLFETTIDDLVRGSVDEMCDMVKKREQRTKRFALVIGAIEFVVVAVLFLAVTVGRDYLEPVLRLLLAVLVLVSSIIALVVRRDENGKDARSATELLGAASGEPARASQENMSVNVVRILLQMFVGLIVGIGLLVAGSLLLDHQAFIDLVVIVGFIAAFAGSYALGRFTHHAWTVAILPMLWVGSAIALGEVIGALASPKVWFAIVGGMVTLSVFWFDGRRRGASSPISTADSSPPLVEQARHVIFLHEGAGARQALSGELL